jgi:hypothetical protein
MSVARLQIEGSIESDGRSRLGAAASPPGLVLDSKDMSKALLSEPRAPRTPSVTR